MDPVRADGRAVELIEGVVLKRLETRSDDRGFFREILRLKGEFFEEEIGQWSHSLMYDGVIKAWHLHKVQADYFYVAAGVLKVALYDRRPDSPTYRKIMSFYMGDGQPPLVLKIPPGVAHGCKTVQGPVHLIYLTSQVYNPADELRLPHDDPEIGFDWLSGPKIR
ncbi:MAG: dTDP-4-dehydrorhamnose 3,5-epimerase family protein [Candidatus Omnitrophica bacterium]|nr:dTDP-4-dehydrorhamnose 3,5-epimerase family protein [Candidatus Omnitrophota bacterium]